MKQGTRLLEIALCLLIIVACTTLPVFAKSQTTLSISTSATISYPTPPPTDLGTNLASMFQYGIKQYDGCKWGQYNLFGYITYGSTNLADQIAFRDDTVTYKGHSSIRVDPKNAINAHREVNNGWITAPPGTHIIYRCWIKTSSGIGTDRAAIIGFDGISATGVRLAEICPQLSGDDNDSFDYPKTYNYEWVPYGTEGWIMQEIDVIIPNTLYTYDYKGNLLARPERIAGILPFLGGNWQTGEAEAPIWFADTELYLNP